MSTMIVCKGFALVGALITCEIPDVPKVTVVGCPKLVQWSGTYQDQLLTDYSALPSGSPLKTAIAQLIKMRDETRECRKQRQ